MSRSNSHDIVSAFISARASLVFSRLSEQGNLVFPIDKDAVKVVRLSD